MNVAVMKTKVEQSLSESFDAVSERLAGGAPVGTARRRAIALFRDKGLPHRRLEEWKYTDLRAALREPVPAVAADAGRLTIADVIVAMGPLANLDAFRVVLVNGFYRAELSNIRGADGLDLTPLAAALASVEAADPDGLLAIGGPDGDVTIALNTAYMTDGAVIRIAPGTRLAKPLLVVSVRAGSERRLLAVRHVIQVGAGAEATIIEAYTTLPGSAKIGQTYAATRIVAEPGAVVDHVKCAIEDGDTAHIGNWIVELGGDVGYRGFQLTAGATLVRNQIFATYRGAGTKLDLSGAFLGRGKDHLDTTLVVDHAVPSCISRELFKGVLDGEAKGVFQGKIIVRPNAQKTDGKQMAKALMLSPDAEFDSKPELEIYADDVACGHGSTSAELDADQLFYCRARGIPEDEARALLTEAFVGEAIDRIEHEAVREALRRMSRSWLERDLAESKARRVAG